MYLLELERVLVILLMCQNKRTRGHVITHVYLDTAQWPQVVSNIGG